MTPRMELHSRGYDCFCFHLLCVAVARRKQVAEQGYDTVLLAETYGPHKQTVYYLAHKRLNQPTRKQRGADFGGH